MENERMRKNITGMTMGLVLAALSAGTVQAEPQLTQGTKELTLQGFADFETREDYFVYLDLGYGTFIKDHLEVGLNFGANSSDASQNYSIGPFVEYNFANGGDMVPYVNAGARWAYSDVSFGTGGDLFSDSGSVALLTGEAGVKYFLRENIAISTGLSYEWASDDIFDAGDTLEDGNILFKLGMRFYL
ncbi:MAG: hypothetical protein ACI9TH_004517 [Kiritimatiellia bacterium]|jgi:hypothetical protein